MFQLVLNSIQKTVDFIAPPVDDENEFKYHCEMIKDYFANEQNLNEINSKLIEDTQVPKHLNEIMRLLLEDNERLFYSNETNKLNSNVLDGSMNESNSTLTNSIQEIKNQTILNKEITISTFMECLLSNKILEIIINAAKFDLPVGISLHTFKFLTRLLNDYKVNLLNHCSILNQINELITICAINNTAGPYEKAQVDFLSVIVYKIKLNYNLIHCFTRHDFPILNSLILMLSSPDNEISDKAGQLLIDLVSIVEDDVVKIILNRTLFTSKINDILIYYYKQIPTTINPDEIEMVLNIQYQNLNENLSSLSYQIRKFLTFFKWFSFLDLVLIKCKSILLQSKLIEVFKTTFLVQNLNSNLFMREEINLQILSTILTFACLKHCKSIKLKQSIIDYLLNDEIESSHISQSIEFNQQFDEGKKFDENKQNLVNQFKLVHINECEEIKEKTNKQDNNQLDNNKLEDNQLNDNKLDYNQLNDNEDKSNSDNLINDKIVKNYKASILDMINCYKTDKVLNKRKILINRCRIKTNDNIDYQFLFKLNLNNPIEKEIYNSYLLSLYTLQLFEEVLNKINKNLFEELFVNNLIKRTYLDMSRYNINNDLNELEDLNKIDDFKLNLNELKDNEQSNKIESLINNPAIKSIKFFVALIPNELKSCNSDFGFEPYIEEAQKRFDECLQICENWKWPKEIGDNLDENESKDQEFIESDFLSMLFYNLTNIIKIPYELNLQITSLISKIALFPNPYLNEYLLNPELPLKENCPSLFNCLHSVVEKLQIEVLGVKQLKAKLNIIRSFLLDEASDLNGFNITNKDQKILEGIIIIEEFCKELAATSVVKNTYLL